MATFTPGGVYLPMICAGQLKIGEVLLDYAETKHVLQESYREVVFAGSGYAFRELALSGGGKGWFLVKGSGKAHN
jgi:hypothetical protein